MFYFDGNLILFIVQVLWGKRLQMGQIVRQVEANRFHQCLHISASTLNNTLIVLNLLLGKRDGTPANFINDNNTWLHEWWDSLDMPWLIVQKLCKWLVQLLSARLLITCMWIILFIEMLRYTTSIWIFYICHLYVNYLKVNKWYNLIILFSLRCSNIFLTRDHEIRLGEYLACTW